jgi:hypothetical protein
MKEMARGWHNEPGRHALAARGIETKTATWVQRKVVYIVNGSYQVTFEPISDNPDHIIIKQGDDGTKIFYLANEPDVGIDIEDLIGEGSGELLRGDDRSSRNRDKIKDILENNPYAIIVSAYVHGGESWFLPEDRKSWHDRFDTAEAAGVWYPDKYLMQHLDTLPEGERKAEARKIAGGFLETYSSVVNGEVYMIVMDEYEPGETVPHNSDNLGGFIGLEYAEKELKEAATTGHVL